MTNTDNNPFKVDLSSAPKDKIFYSLAMFPYPSGVGLHVGHAMNYTANDIIARFKRMNGYSVLNPIGWDSFGLPTEGFAIKVGKPANEVTEENIKSFVEQCKIMDWSFDWDREFATSSPEYYKWTQWIFQQLYKAGLVYRKEAFVNRCPFDQTVLANDQVVDGKCERCGTEVVQKKHMQWFIKITDYAERLINDLDMVDWPEETKTQQRYWIGKSEGAEIDFPVVANFDEKIVVGTERADEEKRNTISAIVQRKSDGKFLLIKWKKHDWISPSIGGVEDGETPEVAAEREVLEETGYKVKAIRKLGGIIESHFFAPNKNVWRGRYDQPILMELIDENPVEVNAEEKEIQEPIWLTYEELSKQITHPDNAIGFHRYMNEHKKITVFTTRPDTIYGVTAIVLAPENESIDGFLTPDNKAKLDEYRKTTGKKTALERQQDTEERSGIFSGVYVTHPLTNEQVPIWYADYVLPDYATGAVMCVPAHDERDWSFANKHDLAIKQVILSSSIDKDRLESLLKMHDEVMKLAAENNISLYLVGSVAIPFIQGVIYRDHNDLDYFVAEGKSEEFKELLIARGFEVTNQRYQTVHELQRDGLTIEIGDHDILPPMVPFTEKDYAENQASLWGHTANTFTMQYMKKFKEFMVKDMNREKDRIDMEYLNTGAFTAEGVLMNSGEFSGLANNEAKKKITEHLEQQGLGKAKTTYKLRDWSVSRQRYWGSPIPFYYTFDSDEKVPYFEYHDDVWGFRPEEPIVVRPVVQAVIRNTETGKYAVLDRKVDNSITFVGGGVEDGESSEEAAVREIKEETGITDVKFIQQIGPEVHRKFYHALKKNNYYTTNYYYLYETSQDISSQLAEEEMAKHTPTWMTVEEILAKKTDPDTSYIFELLAGKTPDVQYVDRYNAYNPHPDKAKWIPHLIPDDELPVILPLDLGNYKPAGKSPLADHPNFPYYKAKDGSVYLRECDTLDTFMCSSFYFIRFIDPKNEKEIISKELAEKTLPVDFYMGGKEHTYGHLLYSRFINKFLYDQGFLTNAEPFQRLFHQGFVLGPDGRKMSKRRGNVVNPSEVADEFGSDTTRTYTMFMGPLETEKVWNPSALAGVKKFIERVERLEQFIADDSAEVEALLHKTIKGVTDDIDRMKFNTAVSKLMVFVNEIYDKKAITKAQLSLFLQLMAPFATRLSQQMWEKLGNKENIHFSSRPTFDPAKIAEDVINLPVQIGGKMKGTIEINAGTSQDDVMAKIQADERFNAQMEGKEIVKIIFVQDKIINIIVK